MISYITRTTYLLYQLIKKRTIQLFYRGIGIVKFQITGIKYIDKIFINGPISLFIEPNADISIGKHFIVNSNRIFNPIGREQKTLLKIHGRLHIGDNVGVSSIAIVCYKNISIGNNVLIGGGVVIYDTDFHSLDFKKRLSMHTDIPISQSINIGDNVFIGAHSTILKGVSIGNNSIIGACSIVTKNIPCNQIWAGNPARFIKNIE